MALMNNAETAASHAKKVEVRPAPYQFSGAFYEACDCFTVCPCWTGGDPDEGQCTGVFAWDIDQGSVDGIDVTGLRAVSVSHHTGFRGEDARQRVVIFIDEAATPKQSEALVAALTGALGGPLQDLAVLMGQLLDTQAANIVIRHEGRFTTLSVGRRILVESVTTEGPNGRHMTLNHGKLSEVLGSPVEIGESWRFRVGLAPYGMEMDLRGRSAMKGQFSYVHTL
jgi:hypothetical protein